MTAKITAVGLAAQLAGIAGGSPVQITKFAVTTANVTITGNETALPSEDYVFPANRVSHANVNGAIRFTLVLNDPAVALANIGAVGAFLADGTLFALAVYAGIGAKIAASPPAELGNAKRLLFIVPNSDDAVTVGANFDTNVEDGDGANAVIAGGSNGSAPADNAIALGGKDTVADVTGAVAQSGGMIAEAGDAQSYVAVGRVAVAAGQSAYATFSGVIPAMPTGSIWRVKVEALASTLDGAYADGFTLDYVFKHVAPLVADTGQEVTSFTSKPGSLPGGYPDWGVEISKTAGGSINVRVQAGALAARFVVRLTIIHVAIAA